MVEIPQKEREKALKIMPRRSQYFNESRKNFLMAQINEDEKREKKLEL